MKSIPASDEDRVALQMTQTCERRQQALEQLNGVITANPEYIALAKEYRVIFEKMIQELSDEQKSMLLKLDEISGQHEALSNEIVFCALRCDVCQNVCQA